MSETFSFRWGIPLLDNGSTYVPNFFLDCYIQAGIKRHEFLTVIHLARYQFERPDSECRPAIHTVARQMGCTDRTLQRTLSDLEGRGLLVRHYRTGATTVYDFSGFSRAILRAWQGVNPSSPQYLRGEPQFTPGVTPTSPPPDTHVTPGVTPSSPEEEHEEEKKEEENKNGSFSSSEQLWAAVLNDLQFQMTRATFDTWLKHSICVACADHTITVQLANEYAKDWLENRLATVITRTLSRVVGEPMNVEFTVRPQ